MSDAHTQRVRGLDYNPNKPYVVLSCGDDYAIRYWDLRKPDKPLLAVRAHSHWTTAATYNRFHDQLVLSCGTSCESSPAHAASTPATARQCLCPVSSMQSSCPAVPPRRSRTAGWRA